MDKETQIEQMNQMLDYLGKKTFTINWEKTDYYTQIFLTYNREDSILRKETIRHNYTGKVVDHLKKEKAMGGTNGNDMYEAIKKAAFEKAEKIIKDRLIQRELEDNNVFISY